MKYQKKFINIKQEFNFNFFEKLSRQQKSDLSLTQNRKKMTDLIENVDINMIKLTNFENRLKEHLVSLRKLKLHGQNKLCSMVTQITIFNLETPKNIIIGNYNQKFLSENSTEKSKYTKKKSTKVQDCQVDNLSVNYNSEYTGNDLKFCDSQISTNTQRSTFDNKYFISKSSQINKSQKQLEIHDFELINFSGEGVFGRVYLALHKELNFMVALKKIDKQNLTLDIKKCLMRQIKIQGKLHHPNIVQLYDFFSYQNYLYLVLEVCSSGSIYDELQKKGPFSQEKVKFIIRQICSGIQYLHSKGIMHRDLKAQNIVLHENQVKICDFGWAIQEIFSDNSFCGTPVYVSPEIINQQKYNRKIDIWSIGILTFELLFNKVPFNIQSQQDLTKISSHQIEFPKAAQISQRCKDFIKICLEKNPQRRPEASQLLQHHFLLRNY